MSVNVMSKMSTVCTAVNDYFRFFTMIVCCCLNNGFMLKYYYCLIVKCQLEIAAQCTLLHELTAPFLRLFKVLR